MALRVSPAKLLNTVFPRVPAVAFTSSHEIRRKFIDFFHDENDHEIIPSSPVTLREDPSLLFVNAGMNQFKPKFLGTIDPFDKMASVRRAVNSQKCIRVGGKHNDLDDVGKDTSHHTFFEMLGSWSFGDYFKEQACKMALELLTKHFEIPTERLYFTYFSGDQKLNLAPDIATQQIWKSLGVSDDQILPFGTKDNFWEMGEVGPCGPCTEIHYNYNENLGNAGRFVNKDHPDVVEIWNVVFMQYSRLSNGSLVHLPTNHVDTGMGLERITAVLQGKKSNYDTDLFLPIIVSIQEICKCPKYSGGDSTVDQAFRIVSDHVRMLTIAIGDQVYPGNTGADLIVRQILRRAYLTAKRHLNAPDGLINALSQIVIESLSQHYTYLKVRERDILETLKKEESRFSDILNKGEKVFHKTVNKIDGTNFPVDTAILLYNHYGYPLDILLDAIKEKELVLDLKEFDKYQQEREMLKLAGRKSAGDSKDIAIQVTANVINELNTEEVPFTKSDLKYNCARNADGTYSFPPVRATLLGIVSGNGELKQDAHPGDRLALVFDQTCFYHTDGGQVCDTGQLFQNECEAFAVVDVTYGGGYVFHHGIVGKESAGMQIGDEVQLHIHTKRREACMRAHTATHLLNHALREILSPVISQQGSKVDEDELRFTFTGPTPSNSDLSKIAKAVCSQIEAHHSVHANILELKTALEDANVRRLTDGIYMDPARVVSIGTAVTNDHSVELCGGTTSTFAQSCMGCGGLFCCFPENGPVGEHEFGCYATTSEAPAGSECHWRHINRTGDIVNFALTQCKSQGVHKTTVRCLTATRANESISLLRDLQTEVQERTGESNEILSEDKVSIEECLEIKGKIGKLNYRVNCTEIPIVCKNELKEILRKHSQMLGTKIRMLHKR